MIISQAYHLGWLSGKGARLSCGKKDQHKNGTNCIPALHTCFRVGVGLSKWLGSVWRHTLQRSPEINRKSKVLYPSP